MLKTLTSLGGERGYVQVVFTHVPVGIWIREDFTMKKTVLYLQMEANITKAAHCTITMYLHCFFRWCKFPEE